MLRVIVGYAWWSFILYFAGCRTTDWKRGTTVIPRWLSRMLLLPYNKTGEIPKYLIAAKIIMQLSTLAVLILFVSNNFGEAAEDAYVYMLCAVIISFMVGWVYCGR